MHPTKCKRPVASGEVSKRQGYAIMAVTIAAALAIAFLLRRLQSGGAMKRWQRTVRTMVVVTAAWCWMNNLYLIISYML